MYLNAIDIQKELCQAIPSSWLTTILLLLFGEIKRDTETRVTLNISHERSWDMEERGSQDSFLINSDHLSQMGS